ncbi:MAG: PQQ-dependent sugar dehydrogenase [Caulobacteraceae bacterium]
MVRLGFSAVLALGVIAASAASTQTPAPAPAPAPAAPKPPVDPCAPSQYAADTYSPKPAFPNQTLAPKAARSSGFQIQTVASGLEHPSAIAFMPDGRMLVAERPGRLRIVDKAGKLSPALKNMPVLEKVQLGGLHDVLLDPKFAANRTLYFAYYTVAPGQVAEPGKRLTGIGRIVRAKLSPAGDSLDDQVVIHEGGIVRRLNMARDGTLLITSGSGGGPGPQSMESDDGKVLRINTDGSIPKDNPWIAVKQARPEIYALGFRDPEGATIDKSTGLLWTVEHGPRGGDELNVVRPGKNYGYSTISYGREYSGELINQGKTAQPGMEQPVYFWGPDIAPSGLMIYTGSMFPRWKGNIFVGGLVGKRLVRLQMNGERVAAEEPMLMDRCQRIRDVRQGPEGAIYLLTDQDDGQVLRMVAKR